jgi:hypothetical protein
MATLAFFLAASGATAIASSLVTGAEVKNGSLTGADVRDHSLSSRDLKRGAVSTRSVHDGSLTGRDVRNGTLRVADFDASDLDLLRGPKGDMGPQGQQGAQGPQGPAGPQGSSGIERASWSGSDVTGYVNDTPIFDQVPGAGGWLMLANYQVTNTSASDDWFGCGLFVNGQQIGGGGDNVPAGTTREQNAVGFGPVDANEHVVVKCQSGGSGTFDLSGVTLQLAKLM